jgi:hypothetical protein
MVFARALVCAGSLLAASLLAGTVACSPVPGYCAAAAECDDAEASFLLGGFDIVGEDNDSENVCVADVEGGLNVLRANEEEVCARHADAAEVYFACVSREYAADREKACELLIVDESNPCEDEARELLDVQREEDDDECTEDER